MKEKYLLSILIVEDDIVLAERMKSQLILIGFKDIELVQSGEDAVIFLSKNSIDIVFMDIQLDGEMTGIQAVNIINKIQKEIAIIYFSSLTDEYIFKSMQSTNHIHFLPKPFNGFQLKSTVDYVLKKLQNESEQPTDVKDFLFIKNRATYQRVKINDIQYIEGGRNNITIHVSSKKKYVISGTFAPFYSKIKQFDFIIRVHRSYIVNLNQVDAIHGNQFQIGDQLIPFSRKYISDIKKIFPLISSSK